MNLNLDRTAFSLLLALAGKVPAGSTPGLDRLLTAQDPNGTTCGVATFDAIPAARQICGLEELGLDVQPMQHLALAKVSGPVSAMQAAVAKGLANDVYLDERPWDWKPADPAHPATGQPRIESRPDPRIVGWTRSPLM